MILSHEFDHVGLSAHCGVAMGPTPHNTRMVTLSRQGGLTVNVWTVLAPNYDKLKHQGRDDRAINLLADGCRTYIGRAVCGVGYMVFHELVRNRS